MNVIPVLDIKDGKVVRGQGGYREKYQPLNKTVLLPPSRACEPNALLEAFEDRFDFKTFYIADLNSIEGRRGNYKALESLREATDAEILLDSGIRCIDDLKYVPEGFTVVIGSETLIECNMILSLVNAVQPAPLWFSLDLRKGYLVIPDNSDLPRYPIDTSLVAFKHGITGLLAIELDRVGEMIGPNVTIVRKLAETIPIPILWGGGVRDVDDLRKLAKAGSKGCLVASALHSGAITPECLASLTNSVPKQ